ncbi:MAG TPA: hypothetical protein VFH31_05385 [Pyrinomonadaceae bacterium]|nr:hypothetical protein [Pyrinomonadaceae bacterium]
MSPLNKTRAKELGFSGDKRKRRNQHRKAANKLLRGGGIFNGFSAPGSSFWQMAQWHKAQARAL